MKYTCPCCGYKTLEEEPPGTFDICSICFWEDDNVQFDDPDYEGGANEESLRQHQKAFLMRHVNRKLTDKNERDPNWRALFEN
ncbi:CPCC family cysteine-rich protein [Bacillus cereus]|uniref:CPCC family cysteine-rich protein n=1 Tax=Bacillus cereus TaxID=1396 RepID=UPI003980B548